MKVVRLTAVNGAPLWVNPESVSAVSVGEDDSVQRTVVLIGDRALYVLEPAEEAARALTGPLPRDGGL